MVINVLIIENMAAIFGNLKVLQTCSLHGNAWLLEVISKEQGNHKEATCTHKQTKAVRSALGVF